MRLAVALGEMAAERAAPAVGVARHDVQGERRRFALQIGVAARFAHLGANLVVGAPGGAVEEVVGLEVAAAAGRVAAEGEPTAALADLDDDHHAVGVRAGDLAFEVGVFAVAHDDRAGAQGRAHDGGERGAGTEAALTAAVDDARFARRAGLEVRIASAAGLPGAWLSTWIVRCAQLSPPVPFSPCHWAKSWAQAWTVWAPSAMPGSIVQLRPQGPPVGQGWKTRA